MARAAQPPGRRVQGQPAAQMCAYSRHRSQRTAGESDEPDHRAEIETLDPPSARSALALTVCRTPVPGLRV